MERKWERSSCRRIRHTKILYSFDANYVLSEQLSTGWTRARSVENLHGQRPYHFNFSKLNARFHNFVDQHAICTLSLRDMVKSDERRDARVDSKTKSRESANDVRQKYTCRRLRSEPEDSPSLKQFRFNSRSLCTTPSSFLV